MASHGSQSVVEACLLNGTILIYGATGYTGRLIAKAASERGARPILAGRNLDKVKMVAQPLGLSARAFDLGDPARIDAAIKDVSVVLCAAGPFSATSRPVADACLRNRVHYLDITGEIDVFEALAARDAEAKARGVMRYPESASTLHRATASQGFVTSAAACWMYVGAVAEGMRKISYAGYRFPPEVIHQAIWLYLRFTLSFRDVEDLLAERGIAVSYETVRRW